MSSNRATKFQKALLHWCETDDKSELIRFTLHAYSQKSRNSALRKSLALDPSECDFIRKEGLLHIKELLSTYIENISRENLGNHKNIRKIDFPIKNAIFANGICCRDCIGVCHGIPYWKEFTEENKEKFIVSTMKWISSKIEKK